MFVRTLAGSLFLLVLAASSFAQTVQEAYVKPVAPASNSLFGQDVSIDGDTMVVGASQAPGGGEVTIYVRSGTTWTVQQTLTVTGPTGIELFGFDVAIEGDTLAVGAPGYGDFASGTFAAGAVYIYTRSGSTWTFRTLLTVLSGEQLDSLGHSVSLSGGTLVAGAYNEGSSATGVNGNEFDNGAPGSGAAYVFVGSGASWTKQAYLKASNTEASDTFGDSVSISGDTIVVGASAEDSSADGVGGNQANNGAAGAGACYVFKRSGTTWSQEAYIKATNSDPGDQFGYAVAVSGDTLVSGATFEQSTAIGIDGDQTNNGFPGSGAAYVYTRSGSTWSPQAYVKASNTGFADQFGFAAALDGDLMIIGAPTEESSATGVNGNQANNSSSQSGAAYVFERTGSTWSQREYLKASNTDTQDTFGLYVAISPNTAVVAAPTEDSNASGVNGNQANNSLSQSGAVYVFRLETGGPPVATAYCTAGTSANGCLATLTGTGVASNGTASGFVLSASNVEGGKDGLYFFGANGRQANPWGNGTSFQCVVPPVKRAGLLSATGTSGLCDGSFAQDLNALWCSTCPSPNKYPGAGATVQAQLWYRDPTNTSNQTTSLSNAVEFGTL